MMIIRNRYKSTVTYGNKGMVLLFILMVMIVLISVVGAYLGFIQASTKSTGAQIAGSQAIYLAEAGLNKAIWYLANTAPDSSTDGSWRTTAYPAEPGPGPTDPQEEPLGGDSYTIWVEDSAGDVKITARGTLANLSRTIEQTVTVSVSGWTEIIYDDFESGFGNWNDGGDDCIYYTHPQGTYAHQGNAAVNLQDDTSTSVVTTNNLSLSAYDEIKVDFWYEAVGLDSNEDFWLQISTNDGSSYTTVQSWAEGTDFQNDTFYEASVIITGYSLTDQTRIRFRCDASNNGDDVYIDEIRVSASSGGGEVTIENVDDTWQEL